MSLSNAKIIAMLSFIFVLNNCSDEKKHVPGLPTFLNKNPFHLTAGLSINPVSHKEPSEYLKTLVKKIKNTLGGLNISSSDFTYEDDSFFCINSDEAKAQYEKMNKNNEEKK